MAPPTNWPSCLLVLALIYKEVTYISSDNPESKVLSPRTTGSQRHNTSSFGNTIISSHLNIIGWTHYQHPLPIPVKKPPRIKYH